MVNKVLLIGNVGGQPTLKTFDNGGKIVNFSLATNETYVNKQGEKVTNTQWHNISFNIPKLAETIEKHVKKGDMLLVEGKINYREYTDKEGQKKYITEVIGESFKFMPTGKSQPKEEQGKGSDEENFGLPF